MDIERIRTGAIGLAAAMLFLAGCAGVDSARDNWRPLAPELARLSLPQDATARREAWATSTHYAERLDLEGGGTSSRVEMHILTWDMIFTERPSQASFTARMAEIPRFADPAARHGPVLEVKTASGFGQMRVSETGGMSCVTGQLWLRRNPGDNLARYNARLAAWRCRDLAAGAYSPEDAKAFLSVIAVAKSTYDGRGIQH